MSNTKFDAAMLGQFIGTDHYYRISPSTVITDGCKYLADESGAYWLMDAIASYLPQFTGREEFISAKLTVTRGSAELVLDNGNGKVLDRQLAGQQQQAPGAGVSQVTEGGRLQGLQACGAPPAPGADPRVS